MIIIIVGCVMPKPRYEEWNMLSIKIIDFNSGIKSKRVKYFSGRGTKAKNSKKFRLAPNVDDLREIVGTHNFNSLILVDIYLGIYTQNKEILRGWSTEVIVV